ncbi:MAG TPA: hypothetical protein VLL94_10505 [Nitrospiraceae bacterium]|nr:hypothetical protein [Nitrospiraceae bacterium]
MVAFHGHGGYQFLAWTLLGPRESTAPDVGATSAERQEDSIIAIS